MKRKLVWLIKRREWEKAILYTMKHPNLVEIWLTLAPRDLDLSTLTWNISNDDFPPIIMTILSPYSDQLKEMALSSSYYRRRFAFSVLRYNTAVETHTLMLKGLNDTDYRLRCETVHGIGDQPRDKIFNALLKLYLNDPVREVRKTASSRLRRDFSDLLSINAQNLSHRNLRHLIEDFSPDTISERELAFSLLKDFHSDDIVFQIYSYFERCGELDSLLQAAAADDREISEKALSILVDCLRFNIRSFLDGVDSPTYFKKISNSAFPSLMRVLFYLVERDGDVFLLNSLAESLLNIASEKNFYEQSLIAMLDAIKAVGNANSMTILRKKLTSCEHTNPVLILILKNFPPNAFPLLRSFLFDLLLDETFQMPPLLWKIFNEAPSRSYAYLIDRMINDNTLSTNQKRRLLFVLIQSHETPLLPSILESFYLLTDQDIVSLSSHILEYDRDLLISEIAAILKTNDGGSRRTVLILIRCCHLREVEEEVIGLLGDDDQMVRAKAFKALAAFRDKDLLPVLTPLLRDPSASVRHEVLEALIQSEFKDKWTIVRDLATTPNEEVDIHHGVLEVIKNDRHDEGVNLLVDLLGILPTLEEPLKKTLIEKRSPQERRCLIERYFKEDDPQLIATLKQLFIKIGYREISFSREYLIDTTVHERCVGVMEATGYIDILVSHMRSASRSERKDILETLIAVNNPKAFHGILIGSRDSDREIRGRALESLKILTTSAGAKIRRSIEEYPDARVGRALRRTLKILKKNRRDLV